jgi:chemotaxis protein MotB
MSDDSQRPIVIKRIKKAAHGHHGGAWKIAYADFVTAMMAFFLLMWLLGSTAKGDLQGISEYFKQPLKVAMQGGSGSGDSSSVIKGGGKDLSRQAGQMQKSDKKEPKRTINLAASKSEEKPQEKPPAKLQEKLNLEAAKAELEKQEKEKLKELKAKLEKTMDSNPLLKQFKKQVIIDITSEGLRIQIVDEKNRPMFDSGSAVMKPYTKEILHEIGKALNAVPNRISLSGHTDATLYSGGGRGYSNWELSGDRANSSRRELVVSGMAESKVLRVVGLSSALPFNKQNPNDPINRRISIIVLNKQTEEAITKESLAVDAQNLTAAPKGQANATETRK